MNTVQRIEQAVLNVRDAIMQSVKGNKKNITVKTVDIMTIFDGIQNSSRIVAAHGTAIQNLIAGITKLSITESDVAETEKK